MRLATLIFASAFALIAMGPLVGPSACASSSDQDGELTFCSFGPKAKVADIQNEGTGECRASAKIQGVIWECGLESAAEAKTAEFKKKALDFAQERCESFCKGRASGCQGRFTTQPKCGLHVPAKDSMAVGKHFGCRKDCKGQAFIYCALYDTAFLTSDPELMAKRPPNCHCSPKN